MDIVAFGTPFGLAFASGLNAYLLMLAFALSVRWLHMYKLNPHFAFVTQTWFIAALVILHSSTLSPIRFPSSITYGMPSMASYALSPEQLSRLSPAVMRCQRLPSRLQPITLHQEQLWWSSVPSLSRGWAYSSSSSLVEC